MPDFLFLIKFQASELQLYEKRDTGTGVFSEFCGISKYTFFTEQLWSTAPGSLVKTYEIKNFNPIKQS